ncbi:MAG: ATP-binding protein [Gemmatimonadota bacterium]|nr:ATP-binding protein [Gemmatimonadota bacterium]
MKSDESLVQSESRANRDLSRAILDALPDLMFQVDISGEILDYNAPDKSQLFAPEDKLLGGRIQDLMPPDFSAQCMEKIQATLDSQRLQIWEYELPFETGVRNFEARFMPLAGKPEVVVIVRDLTENRRNLEALHRAETMMAMGELVGGVAHEVRNPLFSLSATLDAFEARFGDEQAFHKYFAVFREGMDRLSYLMRDLLEYGKPQSSDLKPQVLSDVILDSREAVRSAAEEAQVKLDFDLEACDGIKVLLDRTRIARVFQNILLNAIQNSDNGRAVKLYSELESNGSQKGLAVTVSDEGPGFTEENLEKALEPFYTKRRGGIGLGLAIVKRIVDEHGGSVVLSNSPTGGASVRVVFPVLQSD